MDDDNIPREYLDKYERQAQDDEAGLVRCDSFCRAKKEPVTLDEYRAALEHWRSHSYLSGCSHAN